MGYALTICVLSVLLILINSHCEKKFTAVGKPYYLSDQMGTGVEPHDGCKPLGGYVNTPVDYLIPQGRLLAPQQPHGLRITGVFEEDGNSSLQDIKQIFNIGAKYFESTIKVNSLLPDQTKILSPFCGASLLQSMVGFVKIPQTFIDNGFDQQQTDLILFNRLYSNSSDTTIAFAGPCWFVRRPIYGRIYYNLARFLSNPNNQFQWHRDVQTIIHEMTHVLGFLGELMYGNGVNSYFFQNPTSNNVLLTSQVVIKNPLNPSQYMLIVPQIQSYISQLFNCQEDFTGALLQLRLNVPGVIVLPGDHWFEGLYYREMMLPSTPFGGARMTKLTMSYLKAINLYYQVDNENLVDTSVFGKGKGCAFARGEVKPSPEFCNSGTVNRTCDVENVISATICNRNTGFLIPGVVCGYPQQSSTTPFAQFGFDSRCIQFPQQDSQCLKAICVNLGQIDITIQGQVISCTVEGQLKTSSKSVSFTCPRNFQSFCSVTQCQDWCDKRGFCVNGACQMADCASFIPNCNLCSTIDLVGYTCRQCDVGFILSRNICVKTDCRQGCIECTFNQFKTEKCLNCSRGFQLVPVIGICIPVTSTCNTLCKTCDNSTGNLICLACLPGAIPYPPETDNCIIPDCAVQTNLISDCILCVANFEGTAAICLNCTNGKLISQDGQCVDPQCAPQCRKDSCTSVNDKPICNACQSPDESLIPNGAAECMIVSCKQQCVQCKANFQGTASECRNCTGGLVPDGTDGCTIPVCKQNCKENSCIVNQLGTLTCTACSNGKVPDGLYGCTDPICNKQCRVGSCTADDNGEFSVCNACQSEDNSLVPDGELGCTSPICKQECRQRQCKANDEGTQSICKACDGNLIPDGSNGCRVPDCDLQCKIEFCLSNENGGFICNACGQGKVPDGGIGCKAPECDDFCRQSFCKANKQGTNSICEACDQGLIPNDQNGCKTVECEQNCKEGFCKADRLGTFSICSACDNGLIPDGFDGCQNPVCQQFDCVPNRCKADQHGNNAQCTQFCSDYIEGCLFCPSSDAPNVVCDQCDSGFKLQAGKCRPCPTPNCQACTNTRFRTLTRPVRFLTAFICRRCQDGFFLRQRLIPINGQFFYCQRG